jgi:hypothetical protein
MPCADQRSTDHRKHDQQTASHVFCLTQRDGERADNGQHQRHEDEALR